MTSLEQIEANRRNALKSTGPRTQNGKQNASRNAIRHGLTAETVVEPLEDPEDYKAFEEAIAADYDAQSAVERELILRLASLLWRLRRATSIETGLMSLGEEIEQKRQSRQTQTTLDGTAPTALFRLRRPAMNNKVEHDYDHRGRRPHAFQIHTSEEFDQDPALRLPEIKSDVARRFLRAASLQNGIFERLGRYEIMLWRQIRQTIFVLEAMRWRGTCNRSHHYWRRTHERKPR